MGGSLEYSEIESIYQKYPLYKNLIKTFIETGTYKGQTTRMASKHFDKVYTFEIVHALYLESITTGYKENCTNIFYFLGDSVELLHIILPVLNVPSLYFIDAHISGSDSSFNNKELVPLMSEIDVILTHNKGHNIFILDDARFWIGNNKPSDWSHISLLNILNKFRQHNVQIKEHWLHNDRYIIVT